MSQTVNIGGALLAGVLSFLSPCVLPLIPAYLSFLTGMSVSQLAEVTGAQHDEGAEQAGLSAILLPALTFVAGFSVIFIALGATASVLGQLLLDYRLVIERVAGLAVIVFGVLMLGVVKVPWLYGEARFEMARTRSLGRWAGFVMGMAFAAGWTPCVGPILGSILALAGSSGSVGKGVVLLAAYSAGLGLPFLAVALLFGRLRPVLTWLNSRALVVNRVAGAALIAVGLLILTGQLSRLAGWLTGVIPHVNY